MRSGDDGARVLSGGAAEVIEARVLHSLHYAEAQGALRAEDASARVKGLGELSRCAVCIRVVRICEQLQRTPSFALSDSPLFMRPSPPS